MNLTDKQRKALERVIEDEGGTPGSSLHSWRCEHPDRFPGACRCGAELVDEMAPLIAQMVADGVRQALEGGELPEGWERTEELQREWHDYGDFRRHEVVGARTVIAGPWQEVGQ